MLIIEIAVKGMFVGERPASHYWRVRWVEQGAEADHVELMEDLTGMQRLARSEKGAAWRYYETDVFADEQERNTVVDSHSEAGTSR